MASRKRFDAASPRGGAVHERDDERSEEEPDLDDGSMVSEEEGETGSSEEDEESLELGRRIDAMLEAFALAADEAHVPEGEMFFSVGPTSLNIDYRGQSMRLSAPALEQIPTQPRARFMYANPLTIPQNPDDVPRLTLLENLLPLVAAPDDDREEVTRRVGRALGLEGLDRAAAAATVLAFVRDVRSRLALGSPACRILRCVQYVWGPGVLLRHCHVCARLISPPGELVPREGNGGSGAGPNAPWVPALTCGSERCGGRLLIESALNNSAHELRRAAPIFRSLLDIASSAAVDASGWSARSPPPWLASRHLGADLLLLASLWNAVDKRAVILASSYSNKALQAVLGKLAAPAAGGAVGRGGRGGSSSATAAARKQNDINDAAAAEEAGAWLWQLVWRVLRICGQPYCVCSAAETRTLLAGAGGALAAQGGDAGFPSSGLTVMSSSSFAGSNPDAYGAEKGVTVARFFRSGPTGAAAPAPFWVPGGPIHASSSLAGDATFSTFGYPLSGSSFSGPEAQAPPPMVVYHTVSLAQWAPILRRGALMPPPAAGGGELGGGGSAGSEPVLVTTAPTAGALPARDRAGLVCIGRCELDLGATRDPERVETVGTFGSGGGGGGTAFRVRDPASLVLTHLLLVPGAVAALLPGAPALA